MKIQFKSTGSTAGLATWLKGFKDIYPSLLVEVDLESNEFIAKSFPMDKSIVKYSKLSFEDAGYELTAIMDNNDCLFNWQNHDLETDGRIKIGIYEILSKVIDVVNTFSETEHEFIIDFDICNNVMYMNSRSNTPIKEYQCQKLILKSMSLTMTIGCSQLSDFFQKCDDNTFLNVVCNIGSPSSYEVSIDALNNLAKISSLLTDPKNKDIIKFYSKEENGQRALYALDENSGKYDYLLGYYTNGENGDTATSIWREKFLNATKGITDENLIITLDTAGASRILIDSGNSKIVIAAPQH